jgi:hypothetical protein
MRGGGFHRGGFGPGLAAGAVIGSVFGGGGYYGGGYGPGYYDNSYVYMGDGPIVVDDGCCAQRFQSYHPGLEPISGVRGIAHHLSAAARARAKPARAPLVLQHVGQIRDIDLDQFRCWHPTRHKTRPMNAFGIQSTRLESRPTWQRRPEYTGRKEGLFPLPFEFITRSLYFAETLRFASRHEEIVVVDGRHVDA